MKKSLLLAICTLIVGLSSGFYLGGFPYHWRTALNLPLPTVKILTQRSDIFTPEVVAAMFHMSGIVVEPTVIANFDEFLMLSKEFDLYVADSTWLRKMTPILNDRLFLSNLTKKISNDFLTEQVERSNALPLFWRVDKSGSQSGSQTSGQTGGQIKDKYNFTIWAVAENKLSLGKNVLDIINLLYNRTLNQYWLTNLDLASCLKLAEDFKLPMETKPSYLRDHLITKLR
jgi:hypothetical protein